MSSTLACLQDQDAPTSPPDSMIDLGQPPSDPDPQQVTQVPKRVWSPGATCVDSDGASARPLG